MKMTTSERSFSPDTRRHRQANNEGSNSKLCRKRCTRTHRCQRLRNQTAHSFSDWQFGVCWESLPFFWPPPQKAEGGVPLELNEQRRRIAEFEQHAGSLIPTRLSVSSSLSSACLLRHSATTALLSLALYRSTSSPCPLSFLVLFSRLSVCAPVRVAGAAPARRHARHAAARGGQVRPCGRGREQGCAVGAIPAIGQCAALWACGWF